MKKLPTEPATTGDKLRFPDSSQQAHEALHKILIRSTTLQEISHEDFMSGWISMACIAPGLDPDEAVLEDGGWPPGWKAVAAEAFRRFNAKELTKAELYPGSNKSSF